MQITFVDYDNPNDEDRIFNLGLEHIPRIGETLWLSKSVLPKKFFINNDNKEHPVIMKNPDIVTAIVKNVTYSVRDDSLRLVDKECDVGIILGISYY